MSIEQGNLTQTEGGAWVETWVSDSACESKPSPNLVEKVAVLLSNMANRDDEFGYAYDWMEYARSIIPLIEQEVREKLVKELDDFTSPYTFKDESGMPWKFAGCKTWAEADWATTGYETAVTNIKQSLEGGKHE